MAEKTPEVQKTYKREVSGGMLAFLAAISIAGIWLPGAFEVSKSLGVPIFMFAGGAFGLDSYARQIKQEPM